MLLQYTVSIASEHSKPHKLTCGVPQGSVLRPLLFTTYMTSIVSLNYLNIIAWLTMYQVYTDDTQLFQVFSLNDNTSPAIAVRKMELCVASICQWMKTKMLKLNDDKTQNLISHLKSAYQYLLPEGVRTRKILVTSITHSRNLGVTFDSNMSFERHITNISRTA